MILRITSRFNCVRVRFNNQVATLRGEGLALIVKQDRIEMRYLQ